MRTQEIREWVYFLMSIAGLILFIVFAFSTVHAMPVAYSFTGTLADGGTIVGAFAYDPTAPIATNVRGLLPNEVWGITSSAFTIAPVNHGLPTVQSVATELCTGNCIFGSAGLTSLTVKGLNSTLLLAMNPNMTLYPGSNLKTVAPEGTYMLMVTSGTLTQTSVPEPDTWLLVGLGVVTILGLRWLLRGARAYDIATAR